MDFFKNFVNQVFSAMPTAAKVTLVNMNIKQFLKDLERDETFAAKFRSIVTMFIRREISVDQLCQIRDAAGGIELTRNQIEYLSKQVYYNSLILKIMRNFVHYQQLDDEEVNDLSNFLVKEIDNAMLYDK